MATITITPTDGAPFSADVYSGQLEPKGNIGSVHHRLGSSRIGAQRTGLRGNASEIRCMVHSDSLDTLQNARDQIHTMQAGFCSITTGDGAISGDAYIAEVHSMLSGGHYSHSGTTYSYGLMVTLSLEAV